MNDILQTMVERPATPSRRRKLKLTHRNLPLLMLRAREQVTSYFRPIFRENDLTEQQWRILRALYSEGELMIGQVADRCFILKPSLTGILQRMVDSDLLVKRLDPDDTRRFYVSLTKQGRARFEAMVPSVEAAYELLEARVGADRIRELYDTLDDLLTCLEDD